MMATHTSTHSAFKTHTLICHVDYPLTFHVGKVGHLFMHPCHAYVAATYLDKSKYAAHKKYGTFPFSLSETILNIPKHFR